METWKTKKCYRLIFRRRSCVAKIFTELCRRRRLIEGNAPFIARLRISKLLVLFLSPFMKTATSPKRYDLTFHAFQLTKHFQKNDFFGEANDWWLTTLFKRDRNLTANKITKSNTKNLKNYEEVGTRELAPPENHCQIPKHFWTGSCSYLTIIHRRRSDYRWIFTETKSRWIFSENHWAWGE